MIASKQLRLSRRTGELAAAVPQVVAHRVGRMMAAGPLPGARDQQEFYRMGAEKVAAFQESWLAMSLQAFAAQQQFVLWWWRAWWQMAPGGWMNPPAVNRLFFGAGRQWAGAVLDLMARGMAPVHRRAVANARRLNRPGS